MVRPIRLTLGALMLLATLVGCLGGTVATPRVPAGTFPPQLSGRISLACWGAASSAVSLADTEDAVTALDDVIRSCATLDEWDLAMSTFPAALRGTPARDFLAQRCAALRGLAATPLCQTLEAPLP